MPDMDTISETVFSVHDWAIDRIHQLCENNDTDDAFSIQQEFLEWIDPDTINDDIISIEYMADWD